MNLYLSLPLGKTIYVILGQLINSFEDFKTRAKLILKDIHLLIELCVTGCYFLLEKSFWKLSNSASIGLSKMITSS